MTGKLPGHSNDMNAPLNSWKSRFYNSKDMFYFPLVVFWREQKRLIETNHQKSRRIRCNHNTPYLTNSLYPVRLVQNLRVFHTGFIHFFPHYRPHLQAEKDGHGCTLCSKSDFLWSFTHFVILHNKMRNQSRCHVPTSQTQPFYGRIPTPKTNT